MNKKRRRTLRMPYVKFEYNKKLIGKSTDVRIYRGATILTEGAFTDSLTREPVIYYSDVLRSTVNNWESNYLNIDHSHNILDRIGKVENPRFENGKVKVDLYIHPITQNAKDTISLIDAGYINWLSVEIMSDDAWNKNNERYVKDMVYIGLAIVSTPACKEALIDEAGEKPPEFLYG